MPGISTGVFKKFLFKRQTGLGVIAPPGPALSARNARRVTSTLDLTKASFQSAEVLESQQVRDSRHGVRSTGGTLTGELSVGGYQQFFESILRQGAQAGGLSPADNAVITASTGTRTGTLTQPNGSFITDGHKIGDVVNLTGYTAPALANNNHYCLIIGLTDLVMTLLTLDALPLVAKAAGDPVIVTMIGKKVFIPATGQTRDYYTFEHWFGDVGESEVFTDTVVTGATIGLPPTGMATVEFPMMGLNMQTAQAQYFTGPAPSAAGAILASANGVLIINGLVAGLVTGMTIAIAGGYAYPTGDGIVGSNTRPDVLPGVLTATGQMTVLFSSGYFRDLFINETEASVSMVLTANNAPNPQFAGFTMSRVKFSGSSKDDTNTGLTLTMPYQALENVAGGGATMPNTQTTITIQDSAFI
jgi:hypothetical protein